ncbi:hypothetical protein Ngar_c29600 [Candidatus Nitrososphaera gargensis Ga9.2]|uniref:Uncharacterized protein n=1 Tax=Nitrososphaera gargensis (strain Ga9.2) TaxID=1237085 RepID=K0IKP0_NITGG|nr:hypothetical protein Ngar_c29600 [Candidatus Nitrososphaera gargensis Ga9.2]
MNAIKSVGKFVTATTNNIPYNLGMSFWQLHTTTYFQIVA